jgi:hypothetical protein
MIFPRHCERPTVSIRIARHCERSEAIHLAAQRKNGLLRRFAPRNDGCTSSRSLLGAMR